MFPSHLLWAPSLEAKTPSRHKVRDIGHMVLGMGLPMETETLSDRAAIMATPRPNLTGSRQEQQLLVSAVTWVWKHGPMSVNAWRQDLREPQDALGYAQLC